MKKKFLSYFYKNAGIITLSLFAISSIPNCAVTASKNEYWLYRQIMEANSMESKAQFFKQYITQFPDGRYKKMLKEMEQEIEFAVYNATGQDKSKILDYLELFPAGRFTADARDKLAQLDAIEKMKKEEAEKLQKMKEELAKAAEEKRKKYISEITGAIADWIGISNSTFAYGLTIIEMAKVSQKFKELWGGEPRAECGIDTCIKQYDLSYHFQIVGGTRIDRVVRMVVMVKFKEGKIWGMSVSYVGRGFLPMRELIENAPRETTPEELEDASSLAIEIFRSAIQQIVPTAKEIQKEGMLAGYESQGANYYLTQSEVSGKGIVGSLLIQLLPPPPPPPPVETTGTKGKTKKKTKKEPEPSPPPVIPLEELFYKQEIPQPQSQPSQQQPASVSQEPATVPPVSAPTPPPPGPPPIVQ